jgi:TRAP-type mannitol/chloroaromatic compound transport system permease small subunit
VAPRGLTDVLLRQDATKVKQKHTSNKIFTSAYTIYRCVILTNALYTYRQNTTVVLDVVYLLVLRYMFRPMLVHHQVLWRYII